MNRIQTSAAVTAFALLDILSCSDLPTRPGGLGTDDLSADASRVVATVQVQLASSSISVGQTTQATATLQDRRGGTIQRSVSWGSSNTNVATVSGAGLVTGVSAGTSQITATSQGKVGSATITVTGSPPPTTNPGTVTDLKVAAIDSTGVTLTFTQVNDGTGQPARYDVRYAVAPISWGSATSTTSGSCTTPVAGSAIGSPLTCQVLGLRPATNYQFQLIAFRGTLNQNAVFGGLSNVVAAMTKSSGSPPPPPPGSGTLLFREDFEDANLAGRGWYDNTSVVLSTAEHVTGSTNSAQYRFLPGAQMPTSGPAQRHKFTASNSVYISFYVKYSTNWVGSQQPYHPHEFYVMSTLDGDWQGPAFAYMTLYLEHSYQNGGKAVMMMQDNNSINTSMGSLPNNLVGVTENRSTAGCNGLAESNISISSCYNQPPWANAKGIMGPVVFQPNPGAGYKNNWNFVEAYYQLNTIVNGIGQADGVMQYWFNGTLVIDRHDILYRTGAHPTMQFNQFLIAPYIGDGSPADQSMWLDNLRVATGRIP